MLKNGIQREKTKSIRSYKMKYFLVLGLLFIGSYAIAEEKSNPDKPEKVGNYSSSDYAELETIDKFDNYLTRIPRTDSLGFLSAKSIVKMPVYFMVTSKTGNNPRKEGDVLVQHSLIYRDLFVPLHNHLLYIKANLDNYESLQKADGLFMMELYEDVRPHLRYTYGYDLPSMQTVDKNGNSILSDELVPVILALLNKLIKLNPPLNEEISQKTD